MISQPPRVEEMRSPRSSASGATGLPLPLPMSLLGRAPDALALLRKLTVAVIGAGSVGGRIALLLARMGVGGLLIVDPKRFKPASLATHDIVPAEIGQAKALVVGRRCKAINPSARVLMFAGPVEAMDLAELAKVDLIVMAPDVLTVELDVGQRALWLGRPLFQASVHGPTLTAQVRCFANQRAAGPCPACAYGRVEWDLLARQARFSCEGANRDAAHDPVELPATNSSPALCSLVADLAVLQMLKFLLKLGQPVGDTILETCGFTQKTIIAPLARDPECRLDHTPFTQTLVDVPLSQLSLAEVTRRATGAAVGPDAQFEVAGSDYVEFAACRCDRLKPIRRFISRGVAELARCRKCSSLLVPHSFYTHRVVSASVLGAAVEQPLGKLGVNRVSSILVRTRETGALVRFQPPTPRAA